MNSRAPGISAATVMLTIVLGCTSSVVPGSTAPASPRPVSETAAFSQPSPSASATSATPVPSAAETATSGGADLVIAGRIVTMAEAPEAQAMLIENGTVTAIGTRDEVLAAAADDVPVVEIGDNVAYPGFIDAHAHWIGDRNYYGIETAAEAMEAAIERGWTSISEQWNDENKISDLESLAGEDAFPLRVDAYLALNGVHPGEHYGDWYAERVPGTVDHHLRVRGLKIHLDNGAGAILLWEPDELIETIGRANAAGWQISVHAVSTEAMEMVLDAFETVIGATGPNPLHHRIEHALQVTDEQLERLVAMDLVPVIQLDGVATDWVLWAATVDDDEYNRDYEAEDLSWLGRWRDFVDAGLHVAGSSDAPWFFTEQGLADDIGRPVDEVAGGMDGRGRSFVQTRPWALEQVLTAEEGLRAVTVEAAYALGDEARRGHLAQGTLGDVTVLSGDLLAGTPDEIRDLDVVATIVGGVVAYCSAPEVCATD
jgi:predicted amidohydrolase YtcJ